MEYVNICMVHYYWLYCVMLLCGLWHCCKFTCVAMWSRNILYRYLDSHYGTAKKKKKIPIMGTTCVTLWWECYMTLPNHNVTHGEREKKPKNLCHIVVEQCHVTFPPQCHTSGFLRGCVKSSVCIYWYWSSQL